MKKYTKHEKCNKQIERLIDTVNCLDEVQAESLYNLIQATMCEHLDEVFYSKTVLHFGTKKVANGGNR